MISESTDLLRCKQLIEQKLDWGSGETWTSADFENLQQQILNETGVSLSASTLRRIWGRVDYQHMPSGTTLNTLAQFAGYADWRQFVRSQDVKIKATNQSSDPVESIRMTPVKQPINWRRLGWIAGIVIVIALWGIVAFEQKYPQINADQYSFSSKPLTRTIPNSVVFTYDALASPTDSVFIQQSWDKRRRIQVRKEGHTHTSIYYEPGFYQAKLLVGSQVVKEHPLLIPTDGWLGTISTPSTPVYLKPVEFTEFAQLHVPLETVRTKNVPLQPEPPLIKYANVGNFEPVSLARFSFSSEVKNEYSDGSAACQFSWVALITNGMPISIPFSAKGCVSELMLSDGARIVSGKQTDLSAFGVDGDTWTHLSCRSDGKTFYVFVNNKQAYSAPLPASDLKIVGITFGFKGTGSVKHIILKTGDTSVFQAF